MLQPTNPQQTDGLPPYSDSSRFTQMSESTTVAASSSQHDQFHNIDNGNDNGNDNDNGNSGAATPLPPYSTTAANKSAEVVVAATTDHQISPTQTAAEAPPAAPSSRLSRLIPAAFKNRPHRTSTILRIIATAFAILGLILMSTRVRPVFNYEYDYFHDGGSPAMVLLLMCALGSSLVCSAPLLLVPQIPIFRRAFPFRSSSSTSPTPKPRLHPAVTLTIELIAFSGTLSLQIVAFLVAYWALRDPLICISWLLTWALVLIHLALFIGACRNVHRLRAEQKRKRASLRGRPSAVLEDGRGGGGRAEIGGAGGENDGGAGAAAGGLQGWVELTEQYDERAAVAEAAAGGRRSGGVGGGLSGVGRGY